jgi:hypothetical protein
MFDIHASFPVLVLCPDIAGFAAEFDFDEVLQGAWPESSINLLPPAKSQRVTHDRAMAYAVSTGRDFS